jgi:hypothetical protein
MDSNRFTSKTPESTWYGFKNKPEIENQDSSASSAHALM